MDVLRDAQVDPYCLRDDLHDRTAPVGDPALPVVPIESSAAIPTGTTTETGAAGLVEVQESFDSPGGFLVLLLWLLMKYLTFLLHQRLHQRPLLTIWICWWTWRWTCADCHQRCGRSRSPRGGGRDAAHRPGGESVPLFCLVKMLVSLLGCLRYDLQPVFKKGEQLKRVRFSLLM